MLYVKDVHSIIASQCKVLQELVQMFPDCKWIIVGGSPCQDLTFAGPWRGLFGLISPSSRLFFVLLCVISSMQRLVGPAAVRYLVENAASMLQIHLDAFCQLLRLPADHHGRYVWDPCDFGFQVTRKRNYFRNFDDVEEIGIPTRVFESELGPLIDQAGKCLIDEALAPLLPLLHCDNYCFPFRILKEKEVASLSGLHNFWTRTSIEDAEALPEHLERNYCGNCFHPDLISSALGNNTVLRDWVIGNEEPSTLVADQSEAFQVFSSLCDKVEAEAGRKRRKEKLTIDRFFFGSLLLGSSPGRSALQSAE